MVAQVRATTGAARGWNANSLEFAADAWHCTEYEFSFTRLLRTWVPSVAVGETVGWGQVGRGIATYLPFIFGRLLASRMTGGFGN